MSSPPSVQLEVEVADEPMEEDTTEMKPSDRYTLPARADEVVELWRKKMKEGTLSPSHFQEHWRLVVPRIYSPQPNRTCLDWSFDEQLGAKLLIEPLEQFVWGTASGQPPLTARRSRLCGRVFKQGEPVYSCRECGMDSTCVLCVECFKVSPHRNHKYKMSQSGGGGCCDCGDMEAWKRDPFCELHGASLGDNSEADMSPDVVQRMQIVASVALSYCLRLLTHDHAPSLPHDLRLKDEERDLQQILDQPDCYCTVLYNDETHTFEQVIATLTRVMKASHRDAVELVSLIDREGRALVKCNHFEVCETLKTEIEFATAMLERYTSRHGPSLKVLVMHAHVIAHQMFAMKLLNWIQNFVAQEPSLRLGVGQVALGQEMFGSQSALSKLSDIYNMGGVVVAVMQNDSRMWKAARTAWHRLLISTTLMDCSTKRAMAIMFTKNYASILKDFIRDDHDHSFSISSLSVQLYTTPTLAHHLIAKHDAMFVVMNTFVSECNRRCNNGRLEFDRNQVVQAFKRSQYILYDLKYILVAVPTAFDEDLRKGFLHGLSLMLNLLVMMQGMDSVIRQVGQHMEYEPEWESAFNLHVKLAHSITLSLEWCAVEKAVTAAAYWMALKRHKEIYDNSARVVRELGNHTASVIPYDVSSQEVSIHRPLSRFIAGLHLQLHKHGLSYHSKEFNRESKPKPTPEELIEPVLQTMAMIAQVNAGMWRRNGFALLNQLYFYHNVKCRAEMLDRDVQMLQIGASLIESNEFIIHVLNKFNLLDWACADFESRAIEEDTLRNTISMLEEFLSLMISVVGSRHVPGVGEVSAEDRTKKEIIQMLSVKPMPHSELNKSLPEDQLHETGLETVIREVADFCKPTGSNIRGVYKLKPHLYDEYDTFFYHYTREELSRSEEEQRNRRKAAGQPECCPPPPLPKLSPPFRLLASLLQCDAALHVLRCVLERALDLRARSFSETQVHKALHLIGYGLRDEESGHYEFLAFAESAERAGLLELLQQLAVSPRIDAHRSLAKWVLAKMKQLLGKTDENASERMETDQELDRPACDAAASAEKARRAALAAERRAKLMAQMKTQMNNFISNNSTLFEETNTEVTAEEEDIRPLYCGAALGVWGGGVPEPMMICIMCQEEARVEIKGEPPVLVAYAQRSTVMVRRGPSGAQVGADAEPERDAFLPPGVGAQAHVSSCGHVLHAKCWKNYVDNVNDRENKRPYRARQPAAFDVEKKEYLCPLCERLCNTALPLLPAPVRPTHAPPPLQYQDYAQGVQTVLRMKHQVSSEPLHECTEMCEEMHCQARASSVGAASSDMEEEPPQETETYMSTHAEAELPPAFLAHFQDAVPAYHPQARTLVEQFAGILNLYAESTTRTGSAALYRCTAYTVLTSEAVLRAESRALLGDVPARIRDTLHALVRLAAALPAVWPAPKYLADHALRALTKLETTSPLTHEPFGTMVPLVLTAPSLFCRPAGPARPNHLARIITLQCLRAMITRQMLINDFEQYRTESVQDGDAKTDARDLENCLQIVSEVRRGYDVQGMSASAVWDHIKTQCQTFLRCCCLFYHFLSDVNPPTELTVPKGDTWETMCGYLDLPTTFKELIDNPLAREKALEWSALSDDWFNGAIDVILVKEPAGPPKLIPLPDDFSELMNKVSEFSCPNSEREDSKNPTMCLLCGQLICSQSYCCQAEIPKIGGGAEHVGAGMAHATRCGGGAGVLLRVRDCELLLLHTPARGVKLPAPYLDRYGETDQGLRRGNPLNLCFARYETLRMVWLSHSVQERIARAVDSHLLVTTAWQNL